MNLIDILTSSDPALRNYPFEAWAAGKDLAALREAARTLEQFRTTTPSLYERVRALLFLSNLHQLYLVPLAEGAALLPYEAVELIRSRHFEQAIRVLREAQEAPSPALASGLAAAYRGLAFQTLAEQVRRSVRQFPGNQWMFRAGHLADYPLRLEPTLLRPRPFPVLHEATPVRMDLSHSAWSDIFFLAMDFPEGARVVNISVDLALRGSGQAPRPPIESFLRVIDEPVLRLASVDLEARADLRTLEEVFDYGADYLGLLKAALIASGVVPPGLEGSRQPLGELLYRLTGARGLGLELASQVNDIPKGSRLAVSTNLLASLIATLMRATGQISSLTGPLSESDRRLVAARAILGEWLGGSGGGWQDSGGIWPAIKLIEGEAAREGDPEFGLSRGRLLPRHTLLSSEIAPEAQANLEASLVLVHGGMSQDVGPILEMCTERYLLRSAREWQDRQKAMAIFDQLLAALRAGDIRTLARLTNENYEGPIRGIIPWAANAYTEALVQAARARYGEQFWGFWMLGGMSGGGMGFVFDRALRGEAAAGMAEILARVKAHFSSAVPFAIDPVVYEFAINPQGSVATLHEGAAALLSRKYHLMSVPSLLRVPLGELTEERRLELGRVAAHFPDLTAPLFERLFPREEAQSTQGPGLDEVLAGLGFDPVAHERLRADYRANRIGLAKNLLPTTARIEDADPAELLLPRPEDAALGEAALREGRLAIITLAGGVGSRWTKGAGTVKALIPFHRFSRGYLNFLEVHLAKTQRAQNVSGAKLPHVVTTSYLTGTPIARYLETHAVQWSELDVRVSEGRSIGLRLVPTRADLRYLWEVLPQQKLDEQKEKVRASGRASLLRWVEQAGEASDYRANLVTQCIHPVGHWYEVPNLLLNGTLADLLEAYPRLDTLLLHNVDTLGATADPLYYGAHLRSGAAFTVEVVEKQFGDHGGSLAKINGRLRLVESLSLPSEETEFQLRYYNASTYWLSIERLLAVFGLSRGQLRDGAAVQEAVRRTAQRVPSYITIKDVKRRWGRGQEDIFPVAQFERLWGDMTALEELACAYVAVPRRRGQQLKEVAQLDTWLRDGSAADVEAAIASL
ncbi:MAG: UTP--glucose-1-phosphate uridylyltransferase [Bryobacter sp.]|nr:UTP--glucose-1-phosphate uridylyltransferase [Bryobacter sp.]